MLDPGLSFRPMAEKRATWSISGEVWFIVRVLGAMLAVLWSIEILDQVVFRGLLDLLGLRPRTLGGLYGIFTAPLLHASFGHLITNSVGLLIFGTLTLLYGRREFLWVTVAGVLVGGVGTWLFGSARGIHIGFSGVVFAYFGYVVARGWYERSIRSIAISVAVLLVWGSVIFGAIPFLAGPGISWEAHLFGMLGGILVARRLRQAGKNEPGSSLSALRLRSAG